MNSYISKLEASIISCFFINNYQLNIDRRSESMAYISGRIEFIDGSLLDFKEFVEKTEKGMEKYKYGYNYRKESVLIFRYDNASDPGAKGLASYPHHKHTRTGDMKASFSVSLPDVLEEIEKQLAEDWGL